MTSKELGHLKRKLRKLIIEFGFLLGDSTEGLRKRRPPLGGKLPGSAGKQTNVYLSKLDLEGRG